jgi:lysozyme
MKTSERGIQLIKQFEGFSPAMYVCPAGKRTVGYGHVVLPGDILSLPMTEEAAHKLLLKDLERFEFAVNTVVKVPLSQEQFDALVSLVYNIGENALSGSTLLKKLNAGKYREAAAQFDRWVHSNKKKLPGLVKRRAAEKALFLEGTAPEPVKPLTKSRTMAGATATAAAGGSAVALGVVQQIGDAAPAVSVVSQVAQTAQEHPSGLLIVFGLAVIVAAAFIAYARWDDRRKGYR